MQDLVVCSLTKSLLEIILKHSQSARKIIEAMYRNLKHNFISDFLSYSDEEQQEHDTQHNEDNIQITKSQSSSKPSIYEQQHISHNSYSQNTYSINSNYVGRLNKYMGSSNGSLSSFANSGLSISSVRSGSLYRSLNPGQEWTVQEIECPFKPTNNKFYQRYVLRYTKYKRSARPQTNSFKFGQSQANLLS